MANFIEFKIDGRDFTVLGHAVQQAGGVLFASAWEDEEWSQGAVRLPADPAGAAACRALVEEWNAAGG